MPESSLLITVGANRVFLHLEGSNSMFSVSQVTVYYNCSQRKAVVLIKIRIVNLFNPKSSSHQFYSLDSYQNLSSVHRLEIKEINI